MTKYIKMGFHIIDANTFEFNYAPQELEQTLKEKGFEIVSKSVYYDGYCTIVVRHKPEDIRMLLDIFRERNAQVIEDYKKERSMLGNSGN